MLDTAKTNFFIMNDQNPSWDNDDNLFVSGNILPSQTTTPKFDTEINYQNYLCDDDLEFLNGDDLYVPENTPSFQTATPEFPFRVDYQTYLDDNDIDFLGDNPKVSTNTPDSGTNLELLDNTLYVSEDTQDWDTNMELLEDNNLNLSWNTPNLDNDMEFLEGENLHISENAPLSQPPTEETVLCLILQSIIEGTYDTPVQPENSIPGPEAPQYGAPSSSFFEAISPLIEDLPTLQYHPAERGGPIPGRLGPLAHEMDYINFIGTGSHRRRLRPGVVPRRKTAKIVAAADSEPYYNDGPRMEEFRETREMWMTRLKNARTVMSIRHKRMCSQLTRRPNETARKWTNRLCSRTAIMRRADIKHARKMNPSDPAFDSGYRRVFYETKEKRHRNNAAERARVLLVRRNYDDEHGRPRAPTPTPPDDSDDEKFYDHELDYPCYKPSRKDTTLTTVSPMVIYEDSGVDGSDTSLEASSAANSDVGNGDLYQDMSFQQVRTAEANSDAGYEDLIRDLSSEQAQENSETGYGDLYLDALLLQAQVNSNAADEDLDMAHMDTWFQQVQAEPDAVDEDLYQDTSLQQTQANSDTGYGDLLDTLLQQAHAGPDVEYEYEDFFQYTGFQQVQANSDAECEDFSQDTSFQQTQANSDIGYRVWQNTCLQQTQAKPDDDSFCNLPKHKRRRVRKPQGDIESANGVSKRITTPHACAECKRRKIRCDGRHWQCLGCRPPKQVIAQPQEDKCAHCFTDRRICDQAKPSCGNCVKRKLKCRPQENAVPSSLFFYSEVYSGFPENALNAQV
jgi:hypothetical protein